MISGTRVAGFVVHVYWHSDDRKWNVNTWKLDDDDWNAGNRAFSRNSHGSLALRRGSFRIKTSLPATEHFSNFKEWFRESYIFHYI